MFFSPTVTCCIASHHDLQVTLSDRELEVIRRIQSGAFPHPEFQAYPDYVDYFTHEKEVMPLEGGDEPKRRFIPSKVREEGKSLFTSCGRHATHTPAIYLVYYFCSSHLLSSPFFFALLPP